MLLNHPKTMIASYFSPDGSSLITICSDKTIRLWDIKTGQIIRVFTENEEQEIGFDFSPDSRFIATGGLDNNVKIWNLQEGVMVSKFTGHTLSVRAISFHPGGKFIASAGWDQEIKIWYIATGLNYKTLTGHKQCIRALSFSPDGRYIASGGYDKKLKIWDAFTGRELQSIEGHKFPIESLCFSPDGKYIATGSSDNTIKIWELLSGNNILELKGIKGGIYSIDYSPDGKIVAGGSNNNTVTLWDATSGKILYTINAHSGAIKSVSFNSDGKSLVTSSIDKTVKIWDLSFLHIIPVSVQNETKLSELPSENFNIIHPANDFIEVYQRPYNLVTTLNDTTLSDYRLFVNKSEYVEYDGKNTYSIQPAISKKDGKIRIEYEVYLHVGANEIQFYAGKDSGNVFCFSKTINIYCQDYSSQTAKTNLYAFIVNVPSFKDKKLNAGYKTGSSEKLKNMLASQSGILYNKVNIEELNNIENTTGSGISLKMKDFFSSATADDIVLIFLSSYIAGDKYGDYFFLSPDLNYKQITDSALKLNVIKDYFTKKTSYTGIFIDASHQFPKKTKDINTLSADSLAKYFAANLRGIKNDYSLIISETKEQGQYFELIMQGLEILNDKDGNMAIDANELNDYINQNSKTYSIVKTKRFPLYLHYKPEKNKK